MSVVPTTGQQAPAPGRSRYRLWLSLAMAIAFPFVIELAIDAPADRPLGLQSGELNVGWVLLYAGAAAAITAFSRVRTIALGIITLLVPSIGLIAFDSSGAFVLLGAGMLAAKFASAKSDARVGARSLGTLVVVGAVLIPAVVWGGRSSQVDAAKSASKWDVEILAISRLPGAHIQHALIAVDPSFQTPSIGVVNLERQQLGSWRLMRWTSSDGGRDSTIHWLRERCSWEGGLPADWLGACPMDLHPDAYVLAGLAPEAATRIDVLANDGRVLSFKLDGRGGYLVPIPKDDCCVRAAFYNSDGELLDAVDASFPGIARIDGFRQAAAGCVGVSSERCRDVHSNRFPVSISILTRSEFQKFCPGVPVPGGEMIALGSVAREFWNIEHTLHDRRLVGKAIWRGAIGIGEGGEHWTNVVPLPDSKEPCFPSAANQSREI